MGLILMSKRGAKGREGERDSDIWVMNVENGGMVVGLVKVKVRMWHWSCIVCK